jgi:cell wall-associated NlpC family hydrolase
MCSDRSGADRYFRRRRTSRRLLAGTVAGMISAVALAPLASPQSGLAAGDIARQSPAVVKEAVEAVAQYRLYRYRRTATSLRRYHRYRNQAARATAVALNLRPRRMVAKWAAADHRHQVAVLTALTQLGTEYRSFSASPRNGFDCSGLTSWSWRQAGVTIPRSSGDQIAAAAPRRRATALPGDLVYYPGHVSLYLGRAGAIVHASDPDDDVELAFITRAVRWGDPTR